MIGAVRKATREDCGRIREIAHAAFARYVSRIGREPAPMRADFAAAIAAGHVTAIAVEGAVAGYVVGRPETDAYFIDAIAVHPVWQDKGLGRHLIDHVAAEARRLGLPALRLCTNEAMTENLAIYRHIGFVETHRAVEDGYRRVFLRRDIGA